MAIQLRGNVLRAANKNRTLNRMMDQAGRIIHKANPTYMLGWSRLAVYIFDKAKPNSTLTISNQGICLDEEFISAHNPFSHLVDRKPIIIQFNFSRPIDLIEFGRTLIGLGKKHPVQSDGNWAYWEHLMPRVLERTTKVSEIKKMDSCFSIMLQDYKDRIGNPDEYIIGSIVPLFDSTTIMEELEAATSLVEGYYLSFSGAPHYYVADTLPALIRKARSMSRISIGTLVTLDITAKSLVQHIVELGDLSEQFDSVDNCFERLIPAMVNAINTREEFESLSESVYQLSQTIMGNYENPATREGLFRGVIPQIITKATSYEAQLAWFNAIRPLLDACETSIDSPYRRGYVGEYFIARMIEDAETLEELTRETERAITQRTQYSLNSAVSSAWNPNPDSAVTNAYARFTG
ncbi:MAG: hypothetical protein KKB81_02605 [Candidatus Margulisbacteria bacterium]|nr:hypothetical protein [Candidatus Margulisiibacteriota bacterium]MBU1022143.1 hypothetical protein [Candidatus Margulisiibacteriota bacterium]MBU1729418.1 hypothetical protein [Candidatus Margulisiibacteriota bacterium]MBU1955691.1 hypothetical protein [Candidatus Margulisiibacteriota bacterium]